MSVQKGGVRDMVVPCGGGGQEAIGISEGRKE